MSRVDGRKLSHTVHESIRIEAIQKWLDVVSVKEISAQYSTDHTCVYDWIKRYKEGGFEALKTRPFGGRPHKLSDLQRAELAEILLIKNPTDFGFYKAMWTRDDIVAAIIKSEFGITIHPAAFGKMLIKNGLFFLSARSDCHSARPGEKRGYTCRRSDRGAVRYQPDFLLSVVKATCATWPSMVALIRISLFVS
ncbi:helix-turn-helix domain-containing protein [Endozoicomonas acroporae]|uniref:helix-turn-helix domain-containing protein n=1 Tax=Endozoicomonas acroporae TaxID=1701104 RepID=UPI000C7876F2|nr:helix-turn-helix domain-containing protein [Endozoicomonas acroporae]